MTPEQAYEIIDQLIGTVAVNREVGKKRDEALMVANQMMKSEEKKEDE